MLLTGLLLTMAIGLSTAVADEGGDESQEKPQPKLPGIVYDTQAGVMDIDAQIGAREAYLELIACISGTKEHESLVSINARAQHVHLALLLMGAKAGSPSRWVYDEAKQEWRGVPPKGTKVKVSLLLPVKDEQTEEVTWVEKPLTDFVYDGEKKQLTGDLFVFGGSRVIKTEDGETIYQADAEGHLISLVSFGDETLSWPTPASKSNEELDWYTKTDAIPDAGTAVKLRLRPIIEKKDDGEKGNADP